MVGCRWLVSRLKIYRWVGGRLSVASGSSALSDFVMYLENMIMLGLRLTFILSNYFSAKFVVFQNL